MNGKLEVSENTIGLLAVMIFLILTATGSAWVMVIGSCITLVVGSILLRKRIGNTAIAAAIVAGLVAFAMAYMLVRFV